MSTIPASEIVRVTPNVLSAGGSALDLNGLLLTNSTRVPVGTVLEFGDATSVSDYFGASSAEAALAPNYFLGFDNSNVKPGAWLVAQYNTSDVPAYLRGGDLGTMTLVQLQALNQFLGVVIDGVLKSATINLSSATSFSNAAQLIQNGLAINGPQAASITGSISGTTLTVSAVASGTIAVGDSVSGTGVTANTYVTGLVSGTGGTGTYSVNTSQTAISQAMTVRLPAVSYDSVSGAFVISSGSVGSGSTIAFGSGAMAGSLSLTSALGAVLSQGTAAATPSAFMTNLIQQTQNWAAFTTGFDPDAGSGNANKLLFSEWTNGQDNRYAYIPWDTDLAPSASDSAPTSLGALVADADLSGTSIIGQDQAGTDVLQVAVFVTGAIASIDFSQTNGRADMAFRRQSGLVATASDLTKSRNLLANGYNFYGAYATANDQFVFLRPGSVSGPFEWLDSYVDQIWLNNSFQLALMNLLVESLSIPYNAAGRALIEAGLQDSIDAGVNFGAIRAGIVLSSTQIAEVNAAAGRKISDTLATRGWYLQVLPATAEVRAARGSPPCTFWYTDGGSVQTINLASVELQ